MLVWVRMPLFGRISLAWNGVVCITSNGLRLLTLCDEKNLTISNTIFRMRSWLKTSLMHPRSKHWQLIDFVIARRADLRGVKKTAAIRSAEGLTDHRFIASNMVWKVHPRPRKVGVTKRKLNWEALYSAERREQIQFKVNSALRSNSEGKLCVLDSVLKHFVTIVRELAVDTIGFKTKHHRDWFDGNLSEILTLFDRRNKTHDASLANPPSAYLRSMYCKLRSTVQTELRRIETLRWVKLADENQGCADTNDSNNFYNALKQAYSPTTSTTAPVKSRDETRLIIVMKDNGGISHRWGKHYSHILNEGLTPYPSVLTNLLQRFTKHPMECQPSFTELEECIRKNGKSPEAMDFLVSSSITEVRVSWGNFTTLFWLTGKLKLYPRTGKTPS